MTNLYAAEHPVGSGEWAFGVTKDPWNEPFSMRDQLRDGSRCVVHMLGVALVECIAHHLSVVQSWSDGFGDHDNYGVLQIVKVLDTDRWRDSKWGHRKPGELFYGWNHSHDGMDRDDPKGMRFAIATWEEVEQALGDGEGVLDFHDGRRMRKSK